MAPKRLRRAARYIEEQNESMRECHSMNGMFWGDDARERRREYNTIKKLVEELRVLANKGTENG